MKKALSILLSLAIILQTSLFTVSTFGKGVSEGNNSITYIDSIDSVSEMVKKYDDGKDYVSYDEYISAKPSSYSQKDSKNDYTDYEEKYEFQTSRLFVKSNYDIEFLNSVDYSMIYDDTYLLQFKSPKDAEKAYDYYSSSNNVEYVEADSIYSSSGYIYKGQPDEYFYNPDNSNFDTYDVNNAMNQVTDIADLKQYVLENAVNLYDEVKVAVIDSGVNKEHEAIKGRFAGGKDFADDKNGDGGTDTLGHGTAVASMVVDVSLPNTKIYSYRVGVTADYTLTNIVLAFEQAIADNVDIINCSFSSYKNSKLLCDVVNNAHSNDINIFAAAGNSSRNIDTTPTYPASYRNAVAVGSGDARLTSFSNYGSDVGLYTFYNSNVADVKNTTALDCYRTDRGTSLSTPAVAGACSMLKTLFRDETNDELTMRLWTGATEPVKQFSGSGLVKNAYEVSYLNSALIDTVEVKTTVKPQITLNRSADGTVEVSLSHEDENATIWYKTEGKDEGEGTFELYTKPIELKSSWENFVAYAKSDKMLKSETVYEKVITGYTENGFYCNKFGMIYKFVPTQYKGDLENLVVPENIGGMIPTSFSSYYLRTEVFDPDYCPVIKSITLPKTVTIIGKYAFNDCINLESITAKSVNNIDLGAFYNCEKLKNIEFGDLTTISTISFYNCKSLNDFSQFEKFETIPEHCFENCGFETISTTACKEIGDSSFKGCESLKSIYLPNVTAIGDSAFADCTDLYEYYIPSWTKTLHYSIFDNTSITNVNLNIDYCIDQFANCKIEYAYLPNVFVLWKDFFDTQYVKQAEFEKVTELHEFSDKVQIMALPSSINLIDDEFCKKNGDNLTVYGTADENNLIYTWCKDNDVRFKNISQETAIIEDLPKQITDIKSTLTANVIGFNRTYQWYSNDVSDNTTGTPIPGANSRTFVPADYPLADYYYCVVTSKDGEYDPVTITTGVTQNCNCDYSVYNAATDTANAIINNPDYNSKYDETSREIFEKTVNDNKLDTSIINSQVTIDLFTSNILNAITNIKTKEYTVNFEVIVDDSVVNQEQIKGGYGDLVNLDITDVNGTNYSSYHIKKWELVSDTTSAKTTHFYDSKSISSIINDNLTVSVYLVPDSSSQDDYSKLTFVSSNGSVIDISYVKNGSVIDTSSSVVMCDNEVLTTAPIIPFYQFDCWKDGESVADNITVSSNICLVANYTYSSGSCIIKSNSTNVLINNKYNPSGYSARYDEKVYLTSKSGKQLAIYNSDDELLSYVNETGYIHTPKTDCLIIKEVERSEAKVSVLGAFLAKTNDNKDKASFNCRYFLPKDYKLVECGAVVTGNEEIANDRSKFVIGNEKVLKLISQKQTNSLEYTISLTSDFTGKTALYSRAYIIYVDNSNNTKIIYSNPYSLYLS